MKALDRIYQNLLDGKVYGRPRYNVKFPYFDRNLFIYEIKNPEKCDFGTRYIGWNHYGSSAVKVDKDALNWLIDGIFRTTPEQFEKEYKLESDYPELY